MPEFRNSIKRKDSVRSSFFQHSLPIAFDEKGNASRRPAIASRFLEGIEVEDYYNVFSNFKDLDEILKRHQSLLASLFLLRETLLIMNKHFGNVYAFSEYNILLNIHQILDNASRSLQNKAETYENFQKFETSVIFNTFHQLSSMFRKDHQTLFAFIYAVMMLKDSRKFPDQIWSFILFQKVALSSLQRMFFDPNTDKTWDQVSKFLVNYFNICDNRIPPLVPFYSDTSIFTKTREYLSRIPEENSVMRKFLNKDQQPKTISLNIPTGGQKLKSLSNLSQIMDSGNSLMKRSNPNLAISPRQKPGDLLGNWFISLNF